MTTNSEQVARDRRLIGSALKIRYSPLAVDHAEGVRIYDVEGGSYLDFAAGWSLANLGYSDERVISAVREQMEKTTFAGLISGINEPALDLAQKLVEIVPGDFDKKVWFGLSGSDASEAAQRLILMSSGKQRIVSFIGSWHGTTDSAMGLSGHPAFNRHVLGAHVTRVPYPNPYRNPFGDGSGHVTDQCLSYLENYIFATVCPPEDTAAIFVETVQSDGGDIVPPPDFLPKLRDLCDRHGILLVVDDIKIGLGRTGRMLSYEHGDIDADVVLLGKSLGGGLPLSAVVARSEIMDVDSGVALFTTSGNATSCAAGLAAVLAIEEQGLVEAAAHNGEYLHERLRDALSEYEIVGDVRGLGMIQGVELVVDRVGKEPNQPAAAKIVYRAWELGLICYYAGNWSNVLEITPPLIMTRDEIDEGVAILERAVRDVVEGKVSDEDVAAYAGW